MSGFAAAASNFAALSFWTQAGMLAALAAFLWLIYLLLRSEQEGRDESLRRRASSGAVNAKSHDDQTWLRGVKALLGIGEDVERDRRQSQWMRTLCWALAVAAALAAAAIAYWG